MESGTILWVVLIVFILVILGFAIWYFYSRGSFSSIPRNLKGSLKGTELFISWDNVPGATSYNVYVGTASGQYGPRSLAFTNSFVQRGVIPCNTYYVTVSSLVNGTESPKAREIAATDTIPTPSVLQNGLERILNPNSLGVYINQTGAPNYMAKVGLFPDKLEYTGISNTAKIIVTLPSGVGPGVLLYVSVAGVYGPNCMSDFSVPVVYTPPSIVNYI